MYQELVQTTNGDELIKQYKLNPTPENKDLVVKAHAGFISGFIYSRYKKHTNVEDLIQEGMVALLYALDRFDMDKETPFRPYALLAVKGKMQDILRHQQCTVSIDPDISVEDIADTFIDIVIQKDILNKLLPILSKRERQVFVSIFYEGKTQQEAIEELGLTKSRISNIIKCITEKSKKLCQ